MRLQSFPMIAPSLIKKIKFWHNCNTNLGMGTKPIRFELWHEKNLTGAAFTFDCYRYNNIDISVIFIQTAIQLG